MNAIVIKRQSKREQMKLEACRESLSNPSKFKPTKRISKSYLRLLTGNLSAFVADKYILAKRYSGQKFVKSYVYLIFQSHTDLFWVRKLVHKILPLIETEIQCLDSECSCKGHPPDTVKRIKRRGFGYIKEHNLADTISSLNSKGFVCSVKPLPAFKRKSPTVRGVETTE